MIRSTTTTPDHPQQVEETPDGDIVFLLERLFAAIDQAFWRGDAATLTLATSQGNASTLIHRTTAGYKLELHTNQPPLTAFLQTIETAYKDATTGSSWATAVQIAHRICVRTPGSQHQLNDHSLYLVKLDASSLAELVRRVVEEKTPVSVALRRQ